MGKALIAFLLLALPASSWTLCAMPPRQTDPTAALPTALILTGHTGWVTALAWSPDGKLLASSSGDYTAEDHTVRLWDIDGNLLAVRDNEDRTYSLAWSPDGALLAAGAEDGRITLLGQDGVPVTSVKGESGVVYTLAWSPDGQVLAAGVSGGTSRNQVQLWSAQGELLHTLPTRYSGGKFFNVAWSPDGRYLAGGAIDYTLWQADGTPVFTYERCEFCTPAWALVWAPEGQLWAVGDENGAVHVFDVAGDLVAELQSSISVDALAWSPDGQILAGGSSLWYREGSTFTHRGGMFNGRSALVWSPDGQTLAAAFSNAMHIRLVSREGKLITLLNHRADCLAWSPDGMILASGSTDGAVRLWQIARTPASSISQAAGSG